MSQAPAMPLWTDALIGDTTHLSAEEFGAYLLLLIATWRNNGVPFADDDARLARICRVAPARFRERLRPILVSFFDLSAGTWRQKRLEKEWKYVQESIATLSKRGKLGAQAKWLKHKKPPLPEASNKHMPEQCLDDGTHTQKEEAGSKTEPSPETTQPSKTAQAPKLYAYVGKVVRLTPSHFGELQKTYHGIPDLAAYAATLDAYYDENLKGEERKHWFMRFCSALDKKHQHILAERAKTEAEARRPITERYPNEGMFG